MHLKTFSAFKDLLYDMYKDSYDVEIEDLNLYLHEGGHILKERDIFLQEGKSRLSKNIIVSGSTSRCNNFCQYLFTKWSNCYKYYQFKSHTDANYSSGYHSYFEWENGLVSMLTKAETPLENFEFIFIVSLENVKESHLHDIIKNKLLARSGPSGHLLLFEQILFRESEKCLFILQGHGQKKFDAKVSNLSTADGSCHQPQRNHMSDYVVIVTTEDIDLRNINMDGRNRVLYLEKSRLDMSGKYQTEEAKARRKCSIL